jgi:hypothetical protein
MNKLYKRILMVIFISLIHYITIELLNEKKLFDFSDTNTIGRLTLSLVVAIIIVLTVKSKKTS